MNNQLSNKKKTKISPTDKYLKSYYKPKSKASNSPNAYRSISK